METTIIDAVLQRTNNGGLPVGWVCVTGTPWAASRLGRELVHRFDGLALLTLDDYQYSGRAVHVPGHNILLALKDILSTTQHNFIVIDLWDSVGPASERWGGVDRVVWLEREITDLRPLIRGARATVVAVACSPTAGGSVWRAAQDLRIAFIPSRNGGSAVTVSGRAARPANLPFRVVEA